MSNDSTNHEERTNALKNEHSRLRWELFHRAIAHAKQSTVASLEDASADAGQPIRLESVGG